MNKKLNALMYAVLSIMISACSAPIVDTFGSISGVVLDEKTNDPLAGVTVSLSPSGHSQVTDKEGTFQFENLEPAEYTLTFTMKGYNGANRKTTVKAGASSSVHVTLSPLQYKLSVEPSILDFGKVQTSIKITLTNQGTKSVAYDVTSSNKWLNLSKSSGVVSSVDYITAVVSREGLSAGNYDATITFDISGSQTVVPVKMAVAVNEKPSVTAESFSEVTSSAVKLAGTLTSTGSSEVTAYGFCWSESENPTIADAHTTLGDTKDAKAFECTATGLKNSTRYYFRAYAENNVGISYSETNLVVTTKGAPRLPEIEMSSSYDSETNTFYATLVSAGNSIVSTCGHVWSTDDTPSIDKDSFTALEGPVEEGTAFSSTLKNLKSNTKYYICAYATNEVGTSYSTDIYYFTTPKNESLNPKNGLCAWYKFDGDAKNSYGEAPAGQAIGTSYVEGVSGSKGLKFTGDGSCLFSVPKAMIDQLAFSVSFWAKDLSDGMIFYVTSSSQHKVSNALIMRDGKLSYMSDGYNLLFKDGHYYEKTPEFTHGSLTGWHLITVTASQQYSGADATTQLYIDGEFVDQVNLIHQGDGLNKGLKFIFGGSFDSSQPKQHFNAIPMTIDNLRVYTRVLSATEIQNLYDYEK